MTGSSSKLLQIQKKCYPQSGMKSPILGCLHKRLNHGPGHSQIRIDWPQEHPPLLPQSSKSSSWRIHLPRRLPYDWELVTIHSPTIFRVHNETGFWPKKLKGIVHSCHGWGVSPASAESPSFRFGTRTQMDPLGCSCRIFIWIFRWYSDADICEHHRAPKLGSSSPKTKGWELDTWKGCHILETFFGILFLAVAHINIRLHAQCGGSFTTFCKFITYLKEIKARTLHWCNDWMQVLMLSPKLRWIRGNNSPLNPVKRCINLDGFQRKTHSSGIVFYYQTSPKME